MVLDLPTSYRTWLVPGRLGNSSERHESLAVVGRSQRYWYVSEKKKVLDLFQTKQEGM